MAFNSYTYYANKYAELRNEAMRQAREWKQRGHPICVTSAASLARAYHRVSLSNRRLNKLERKRRQWLV